uniref:Membrane protein a159 n=1 Tax=Mastomys natalensis cytomegalovirus 1 TaxID=2973541 RepID=A0A9Y1IJW5_9BETA|nr:membrane protein a159 [Mastomys natalensis cytomegalovirus 1]WEG69008.1 membrane protein a159 [Mastomys natalensis cytomegalovirus 1]WEG71236.1 membrane protein a159 [Mastomys natalensis cytomegalovirus 1]
MDRLRLVIVISTIRYCVVTATSEPDDFHVELVSTLESNGTFTGKLVLDRGSEIFSLGDDGVTVCPTCPSSRSFAWERSFFEKQETFLLNLLNVTHTDYLISTYECKFLKRYCICSAFIESACGLFHYPPEVQWDCDYLIPPDTVEETGYDAIMENFFKLRRRWASILTKINRLGQPDRVFASFCRSSVNEHEVVCDAYTRSSIPLTVAIMDGAVFSGISWDSSAVASGFHTTIAANFSDTVVCSISSKLGWTAVMHHRLLAECKNRSLSAAGIRTYPVTTPLLISGLVKRGTDDSVDIEVRNYTITYVESYESASFNITSEMGEGLPIYAFVLGGLGFLLVPCVIYSIIFSTLKVIK